MVRQRAILVNILDRDTRTHSYTAGCSLASYLIKKFDAHSDYIESMRVKPGRSVRAYKCSGTWQAALVFVEMAWQTTHSEHPSHTVRGRPMEIPATYTLTAVQTAS